jgi:hypothetical protein
LDYYFFNYLWENRFDLKTEDIRINSSTDQRLSFHNVIHLKRNDSFLTELDDSCNGILSGLAGAYLSEKKRIQPEENGFEKLDKVYQDGARVFINTILEEKIGESADVALADLLTLSAGREQNNVRIQVKSLSDAISQLVTTKAKRSLIGSV